MDFQDITNFCITIFMICSPFSAVPALVNLTQNYSTKEKKRIGILLSLVVALVLVTAIWTGTMFLQFFGISIYSFEAAGGGIVILLALSMLRGQDSSMKKTAETKDVRLLNHSIPIVPIAIPLIAGPGAISYVIVATDTYPGMLNQVYLTGAVFFVVFLLGLCLYFASSLKKMVGNTGMDLMMRLGGLILASIGVEVLAKGLLGLFPILGAA